MKEGVNLKLLSRMVESDFKLRGYDLIHALGHGVGLEVHELPYASTRIDFNLKTIWFLQMNQEYIFQTNLE